MLKNGDLIVAVGKTTAKEGVLEKHFVLVERFGSKPEQKVGVLMEISDVPGKLKMSKILSGDSMEVVPYDSLIVLE